jgi:hypothetical protein
MCGYWLFAEPRLLLSALFAVTDASSAHEKVRIVTESSSANYLTTGINLDAIVDEPNKVRLMGVVKGVVQQVFIRA